MSNFNPNLSKSVDQNKDKDGVDHFISFVEQDSKLLEHVSLRTLKGRSDTVKFFKHILPKIGEK